MNEQTENELDHSIHVITYDEVTGKSTIRELDLVADLLEMDLVGEFNN